MKRTARSTRTTRGQGMTEYIIIVALIAIGTIGVTTKFGDNVRVLFGMAADATAGASNVANGGSRGNAAGPQTRKTIGTFAQNN
ncbi:MAG: hypothetical protein K1X89_15540 [Myxococcaceae bacterium]|nr:hypothetical protein [Myxococcaceae bacterium]